MRPLDFERFCVDYNVESVTEGHKHARPGWVQIACPFCTGNPGYHLGFCLATGHFNCYRCGWHPVEAVVRALAGIDYREAQDLVREYQVPRRAGRKDEKGVVHAKVCKLPPGTDRMTIHHKSYLMRRGYDPDRLEIDWDLRGTGPLGQYCHRIVAPVYLNGRLVSYQCRDWTGKSTVPYKACREEDEVVHHKHVLYGEDYVPGDRVVVVEGIADAWRLGYGAVATFGIGFTKQQVKRLLRWQRIFILYDNDPRGEGQQAAGTLASVLMAFRKVEILSLKRVKDPGEMEQGEADRLMKEVLE